jgi:hypothetical protein
MERKDRNFYYAHGYLAIKQAVKDIELNPLREEIGKVVSNKIEGLYKKRLITNKYRDLPLSTRLWEVNKDTPIKEQMWVR